MNKSFSLNDYGVYTVTESFKTNFHIPIPYSRLILHLTIECFPFCENYAKLYFNVKYFEKGLNRREGVKLLEPFFHKKVPFQANIECCPRFLKYALYSIIITTESYPWLPWSLYDKVFFIFYFSNIMVMSQKVQNLFLLKPSWNPWWKYISWKKYWFQVMKGKNYLQKNEKEFCKICKTLRKYEVPFL